METDISWLKQVLLAWLVICNNFPLQHFGLYGIIFMNMCVVIVVARVMLLWELGN
jgi:hypothetical protein